MLDKEPQQGMFHEIWNELAEKMGPLGRILKVLFGDKEVPKGLKDKVAYVTGASNVMPEPKVENEGGQKEALSESRRLVTQTRRADVGGEDINIEQVRFFIKPGTGNGPANENNNPGNLRKDPKGKPGTKGFVRFDTPADGFRALMENIQQRVIGTHPATLAKLGRPAQNLKEMMSVYAPAADNNDPNKYATYIAKGLGVSVDEPIENLRTRVPKMAQLIAKYEGYNGKIDIT